ncbi:unnamed protein product [Prunus armeniaca]
MNAEIIHEQWLSGSIRKIGLGGDWALGGRLGGLGGLGGLGRSDPERKRHFGISKVRNEMMMKEYTIFCRGGDEALGGLGELGGSDPERKRHFGISKVRDEMMMVA